MLRSNSRFATSKRHWRQSRKAFSLVEALMAISMLAFAGSILLMVSNTTINTADDSLEQLMARGIAERLMDEVLSFPYMENPGGGNQATPAPESGEYAIYNETYYWGSRTGFDDTGDFNRYVAWPLSNRFGTALGKDAYQASGTRISAAHTEDDLYSLWYGYISIQYADPNDLSQDLASGTSDYRSATVYVFDSQDEPDREIYRIRRVYSFLGQ